MNIKDISSIIKELSEEAERQRRAHPHDIDSDGSGMMSRNRWGILMLRCLATVVKGGSPGEYRASLITLGAVCLRAAEAYDAGKGTYEADDDREPPSSRPATPPL